jgi:6-phosphogluconolactonase
MAVSADRQMLYVGQRGGPAITSFRIDQRTGGLAVVRTAAQPHVPTFLAPDRTGRFMLVAYYQGGGTAVFRLAADGTVGAPSQDWLATAAGAHAIATDRSNRFAYVPHIARIEDNVLEPPKNIPGPNTIMQFRFDAESGRLSPDVPPQVRQADLAGPRHYCFYPSLDLAYFSNEQGCRVTSYRINPSNDALTALQTIATLPAGFDARNTCSQIHLTPSGRFLYVGNRGHNGIAGFRVAPDTGLLMPTGHAATEVVPSAFCLDPDGRFLFAAGTASGRLASYRIDGYSGALTPLAVEEVGPRPTAGTAVRLGN